MKAMLGLVALLLGLVFGGLAHGSPSFEEAISFVGSIGGLWTNALRMVVIPLTSSLLFCAVLGHKPSSGLGKVGAGAVLLFIVMLVMGALFSLLVTQAYLGVVGHPVLSATTEAAGDAAKSFGLADWLTSLIPVNPIEAAVKGDILQLSIFTLIIAFAARALPTDRVAVLDNFATAVRDTMLKVVGWLMILLPLGVFCLSLKLAFDSGFQFASSSASFLLLNIVLLVPFGLILLFVGGMFSRFGMRKSLRASYPPMIAAATTRSSLACLPVLIAAAENLGVDEQVSAPVLPLSVAVFKVNRTITSVAKLLFIGAAFAVPIGFSQVATFVLTVMVLSFSTPGIPNGGGSNSTFGAYLAAGLPAGGILVFEAVENLTDIFKTVINVVADFVVVLLLDRQFGSKG